MRTRPQRFFARKFLVHMPVVAEALLPHELVLHFAKPGLCLTARQEPRGLEKISALLTFFLKQRFTNFMCENARYPVAVTYSSDATPLSTRERRRKMHGDLRVQREGGSCTDFLIQRVWAQKLQGKVAVYVSEPLALLDKTAASHFGAAR